VVLSQFAFSDPTFYVAGESALFLELELGGLIFQSPCFKGNLGVFYTCFYNHGRRIRLEKLLHLGLSRSPGGCFKPLLGLEPGGAFSVSEVKLLLGPPRPR
jgi:hypothetical protein